MCLLLPPSGHTVNCVELLFFLQVVNCIVNYLEVLKLFLNKIHVNFFLLFHIADALFEPAQIKATNGILCILINAPHTDYTI